MRITATVSGSLTGQIRDASREMARAVTVAVTAATDGAKEDLRGQLGKNARFDRFKKAIQSRVYPKPPRFSVKAAGTVFAAGDAADRAFSAFSTGKIVTAQFHAPRLKTGALAIPLHNYRGADRKLLGPRSSFFRSRLHFIPARKRSGDISVGILATRAAGRASEVRKQLKAKGRARIASHLVGEWVPQFVLVRSVKLPKLLSPEQAMEKWLGAVPALIDAALRRDPE